MSGGLLPLGPTLPTPGGDSAPAAKQDNTTRLVLAGTSAVLVGALLSSASARWLVAAGVGVLVFAAIPGRDDEPRRRDAEEPTPEGLPEAPSLPPALEAAFPAPIPPILAPASQPAGLDPLEPDLRDAEGRVARQREEFARQTALRRAAEEQRRQRAGRKLRRGDSLTPEDMKTIQSLMLINGTTFEQEAALLRQQGGR